MPGGAREGAGAPLGNQNASKRKIVREAFHKYVTDNPGELRLVIMKVFSEAQAGNMQAAGLIFDRVEGKAPQAMSVDGDGEGGAIKTLSEIVLRAVDAADGRPASQDP